MGLTIELIKGVLRLRPSETDGKTYLEYSKDGGVTWTSTIQIVNSSGMFEILGQLADGVKLNFGTDKDFSIRYDAAADQLIVRDEINAKDLLKLSKNKPVVIEIPVPVIFEVAKTGLAADSTGVKFESLPIIPPVSDYLTVAIEATWTASATDSITAIEVYDATASAVKTSVSGNNGTDVKSSYVTVTAGNKLTVRVNVTTASATAGATTTVNKAILYFRYSLA